MDIDPFLFDVWRDGYYNFATAALSQVYDPTFTNPTKSSTV